MPQSTRRTRSFATRQEDSTLHNSSSNISASTVESDGDSMSTESGDLSHTSNGGIVKKKRGRIPKSKTNKKIYKYASMLKEEHNNPIFGVCFNHLMPEEDDPIFATVGSNRISIYECRRESNEIKLLLCYADPDLTESFFTCAWSRDPNSAMPLLAAGGARGIVRIILPCGKLSVRNYSGYGQAINELIFIPTDFNLLLSASKDYTLRLWNIVTDTCVAIFGGVDGHRDEILSLDVSVDGKLMASCGIDHSIKIWKLDSNDMKDAIEKSYSNQKVTKERKTSNPHFVYFPDFSTRDVHTNYVDCVRWWNNLILSKSCDNRIVCWKANMASSTTVFDSPKLSRVNDGTMKLHSTEGTVLTLFEFEYNYCDIWFMKFALDPSRQILALGNQIGKIFIWDLMDSNLNQTKPLLLTTTKCSTAIRQIAFSADSTILIAVCDDATVWRWNLQIQIK